jgi:type IV secretory pathway component VirB8
MLSFFFDFFKKNRDARPPEREKAPTDESRREAGGEYFPEIPEGIDYETTVKDLYVRSEKRAWIVAYATAVGFILSVVALVALTPLKTETPYLVRVDNATGAADIISLMQVENTSYGEVIDKKHLSDYVKYRDGYDWWTVQKTHDATKLMSSATVAKEYEDKFDLHNRLGQKYRVDVDILSISITSPGIAAVRYQTTQRQTDASGVTIREQARWVATIGYMYENPTVMRESDRRINPIGFQVVSWMRDHETFTPARPAPPRPAAEGQGAPPPAPAPAPTPIPPPQTNPVTTIGTNDSPTPAPDLPEATPAPAPATEGAAP